MDNQKFKQLDDLAWEVVCDWYKKVQFDPVYDGVDFSLLTRPILRSKVGRALRISNKLIDDTVFIPKGIKSVGFQKQRGISCWQTVKTVFKLKFNRRKKVCYIPQYARPLTSIAGRLFDDGKFLCVLRDSSVHNRFVYPFKIKKSKGFTVFLNRLYDAVILSFQKYDITLDSQSLQELHSQIVELGELFIRAKYDLRFVKPDFVLCYSDESLPQLCYVLLARQHGIKTVSLQHGLDCENFYLDEPYADLLLVWGEWRKRRYEKSLNRFGSEFLVVGNPQYDDIVLTDDYDEVNDGYWLLVTRPHSSEKCYSPSRLETEGLKILNSILDVLKDYPDERLVIKPHPYDYLEEYEKAVKASGLVGRVSISDKPPVELYGDAKLVISEDSTAGLEAVLLNRKLLHVHFAASSYVLPFKEYGVGYLATDGGQMRQMLEKLMDNEYNSAFYNNKCLFVKDFLYKLDGQATQRALEAIRKYVDA